MQSILGDQPTARRLTIGTFATSTPTNNPCRVLTLFEKCATLSKRHTDANRTPVCMPNEPAKNINKLVFVVCGIGGGAGAEVSWADDLGKGFRVRWTYNYRNRMWDRTRIANSAKSVGQL